MADGDLTVGRFGLGWAVHRGGTRVSKVYSSRLDAEARMDRIALNDRKRVRPCLCCSRLFTSEGPHNRLCDTCRTGSGEDWTTLSYRRLRMAAGS